MLFNSVIIVASRSYYNLMSYGFVMDSATASATLLPQVVRGIKRVVGKAKVTVV